MISETTIERTLARLENASEDYETEIRDFAESQPELMEYLTNEDVEAFTERERELLLFAALVIFQSVEDEKSGVPEVSGEQIAAAEESNYETMGEAKGSFRDRLNPFFEQSREEDLLAFVEDLLLAEDGEDEISREAREPFFVTLKTVIDTLT
ncbi:hypothetical protein GGR28_001543 [Lewinella aquimaris]|uniref:Uncharacterized protein n=1 Tax=Neolewinella aquimaris TaxID=1835722 RepID=A0A840EDB0_9BACT|nr:hypothetical protein [Neolewinella aquimaris]MBB4078926.1 hypothetical protein [Neolewinella aquimaris]